VRAFADSSSGDDVQVGLRWAFESPLLLRNSLRGVSGISPCELAHGVRFRVLALGLRSKRRLAFVLWYRSALVVLCQGAEPSRVHVLSIGLGQSGVSFGRRTSARG